MDSNGHYRQITPPILLSGSSGANLSTADTQYLVSTALIVSGLLSLIQITRFHIYKTPYAMVAHLLPLDHKCLLAVAITSELA